MPPIPDGIPWVVWLVAAIATPALGTVASIAVALITRRDTKRELGDQRAELATIREHTSRSLDQLENTHTTNLRNDLDKLTGIVTDGMAAIRTDVGGLHSETRDLRNDVAGIRADGRHDRRKLAEQEKALDVHLSEVPALVEQVLASHVGDCPLRQAHGS